VTTPTPDAPAGYLSEQAKRSYTLIVGVLGVVALAFQFLTPFFAMTMIMPSFFLETIGGMRHMKLGSSAVWRDALWFPEETVAAPNGAKAATSLGRISLTAGGQAERTRIEIPEDAVLLADTDQLWILSLEGVSVYADGKIQSVPAEDPPGRFGSPFLLDGKPAAVVARPAGYSIVLLDQGRWTERWSIATTLASEDEPDLRAVAAAGVVHVFLSRKEQVFHRVADAPGAVPLDDSWEPVAAVDGHWGALDLAGTPAVYTTPRDGMQGSIRLFRPSAERWEKILEIPSPVFSISSSVLPAGPADTVLLASAGAFGNARVATMRDGKTVSEKHVGKSVMPGIFGGMMLGLSASIVAVGMGFAIALSLLMPRFRRIDHVAAGGAARYAPVWRRAVAEVIDAVVLAGPLVFSYASLFRGLGELDASFRPDQLFMKFGLVAASFAWLGAMFLVYAGLEGRWGATPGKYALGIRTVGTDLRPCGFVRALVRNLLTVVDGFFYFLVGLIVIALTENWQRIGDLAARTIVIRAPDTSGNTVG
jgi:uncharacterized RDD family membrane protein YckC